MKHLRYFIGLMLVGLFAISASAAMAQQTRNTQPQREPQPPLVAATAEPEPGIVIGILIQPAATQPPMCQVTVGYDATYWGSAYAPHLSNESSPWVAVYFNAAPGQQVLTGTPVAGIVYTNGFDQLPPEAPHYFPNPASAVAVTSNPATIQTAIDGGSTVAWELAWPNPNGGLLAENGVILYRVMTGSSDECGPIVGMSSLGVDNRTAR